MQKHAEKRHLYIKNYNSGPNMQTSTSPTFFTPIFVVFSGALAEELMIFCRHVRTELYIYNNILYIYIYVRQPHQTVDMSRCTILPESRSKLEIDILSSLWFFSIWNFQFLNYQFVCPNFNKHSLKAHFNAVRKELHR